MLSSQPGTDLDKLKSETGSAGSGLTSSSLYGDAMGYGKLAGDMYPGAMGDYSRLLGAGGGPGPDYSKLLGGGMNQGLYHSFMQNSYMTSQLNMAPHHGATSLPNLPSSY